LENINSKILKKMGAGVCWVVTVFAGPCGGAEQKTASVLAELFGVLCEG
jgi:hypothetical protein